MSHSIIAFDVMVCTIRQVTYDMAGAIIWDLHPSNLDGNNCLFERVMHFPLS